MKPWEETWEQDGFYVWIPPSNETLADFSNDGRRLSLDDDEADTHIARARLAACAPEMARMLLGFEWSGREESEGDAMCLSCGNWQCIGDGHQTDCAWLLLMKKAGIR